MNKHLLATDLTCGLRGSRERFTVGSLGEAVAKFAAVRTAGEFGMEVMPDAIIYSNGLKIARISYNGRLWANDGSEIPQAGRKTVAEHNANNWSDFLLCAS